MPDSLRYPSGQVRDIHDFSLKLVIFNCGFSIKETCGPIAAESMEEIKIIDLVSTVENRT